MSPIEQERLIEEELQRFQQSLPLDFRKACFDVQRVLAYIHDHLFDEALNVDAVLARCKIRSHGFSSRFKHQVWRAGRRRVTIRQYIEDRRMEAAQCLLRHERLELFLIASSLGYAHYETFNRAFNRFTGQAPSQFRQKHQAKSSGEIVRPKRQVQSSIGA